MDEDMCKPVKSLENKVCHLVLILSCCTHWPTLIVYSFLQVAPSARVPLDEGSHEAGINSVMNAFYLCLSIEPGRSYYVCAAYSNST